MKNEYEIISHNNSNFHIYMVNVLYRSPHIHKDREIALVIDGAPVLITPDGKNPLKAGDIFITNPFFLHEIRAQAPALFLSLQISPAFFTSCYPQIEQREFVDTLLSFSEKPDICRQIRSLLFELARAFYKKQEYAPLKCNALISQLFFLLLTTQNSRLVPEKERQNDLTRGKRMREILHYIENHYTEKLLLSDIAKQENLDLYYLSHFFKECFGTTFQDYVMKLRCEKARQLLLSTDYSLLDISISSGFSDPKYFNKGFQAQYGCTPKNYRKEHKNISPDDRQYPLLTTQEFLSESESLCALDQFASAI